MFPALPIACGRISRKTAPSRVPIAKLTSAGTQLAGAERANIAAMAMLITPPATVAAEIQAIGAMLLAFLQPDEARHSAGGPVSTKGEKTLLARSTELAPIDLGDPCCGEPLPRKVVEIGEVRPVLPRRERLRGSRVSADEGLADVLSDLVAARSDARPDVGDDVPRRHTHGPHHVLDDSPCKPAPSRVGDPHAPARAIAERSEEHTS